MKGRIALNLRVVFAVLVAMGLAIATAAPAMAQDDWLQVQGSGLPVFTGQQGGWHVNVWPPGDGVVTTTFDWGDGSTPLVLSSDSSDPETTLWPGDGMYWADATHIWSDQGFYTLRVTAAQGGSSAVVVQTVAVWNLREGGSVKGSGTVWARDGGMYDQEFAQTGGLASFKVTASRRAGTTATKVALYVSVPSMQPDYPQGLTVTGMTFNGSAALVPLYVDHADGEIWLERVYGTVTNSNGAAGTGYANFHAIVKKGQPTSVKIQIWNTSAGYTYVSTGATSDASIDPFYGIDTLHDRLLSGSVKLS